MDTEDAKTMISALCVRHDSVYYRIPGVDPWDSARDCRKCTDSHPVIAHPPCAQWGRTKPLATVDRDQKALALFCLNAVRKRGGVLEHPLASGLWSWGCIPSDGNPDMHGGRLIIVDQFDFGHPARKMTGLYIVGLPRHEKPISVKFFLSRYSQPATGVPGRLMTLKRLGREATPKPLAEAMVALIRHYGIGGLNNEQLS